MATVNDFDSITMLRFPLLVLRFHELLKRHVHAPRSYLRRGPSICLVRRARTVLDCFKAGGIKEKRGQPRRRFETRRTNGGAQEATDATDNRLRERAFSCAHTQCGPHVQ